MIALAAVIAAPFVGSFLGLVVARRGAGETVVRGRSRCRSCGATLGPLELIPLLGWIALRGRCRRCREPIPALHPVIEASALLAALGSVAAAPPVPAVIGAALGWALLLLAAIDAREMVLPDALTLPLIAAGLGVALAGFGDPMAHAVGAAVGYGLMWGAGAAFEWLTGREGLGLGDAKLFAAAGAWVGWTGLPSVLLIGSLATFAWVVARTIRKAGSLRDETPFGPGLALGLWVTWTLGPLTAMPG